MPWPPPRFIPAGGCAHKQVVVSISNTSSKCLMQGIWLIRCEAAEKPLLPHPNILVNRRITC